jgi:predicted transcriptional regulator
MAKEAVFTVKLESELRDAFAAEAAATHQSGSQLVREFMREFVQRRRDAREHDAWFRREVELAVREADDPRAAWDSQEEVKRRSASKRASWLGKSRGKGKATA